MAALVDNSPKGMSDMLLKGMDMADKGMHENASKYPHAERAAHELADAMELPEAERTALAQAEDILIVEVAKATAESNEDAADIAAQEEGNE